MRRYPFSSSVHAVCRQFLGLRMLRYCFSEMGVSRLPYTMSRLSTGAPRAGTGRRARIFHRLCQIRCRPLRQPRCARFFACPSGLSHCVHEWPHCNYPNRRHPEFFVPWCLPAARDYRHNSLVAHSFFEPMFLPGDGRHKVKSEKNFFALLLFLLWISFRILLLHEWLRRC